MLYCAGLGIAFIYYWPTLLALVSRTAPAPVNATLMGIAFLTLFVANNLIGWLGRYYDSDGWVDVAEHVVASQREFMLRAPSGLGTLWQVAELLLAPRQELVIIGSPDAREPFEREAASGFRPWLVIAPTEDAAGLRMFEGRDSAPGAARAFVCEDMACHLPAEDASMLAEQLARL